MTGYTAYKVQFPECVHQCADDSNPVCSVCHKKLYTKITAKAADGTTKTAYFTEDSALENGYVEAIQTLNGWSNEGCTEPTLTLLRDMYAYGTSMPLTGTLTLKGGTHTAKNVTVAKNADVTFASGSYKGATIDGTATVKEGVTFTDASVEVNGTLNAKGGTFTGNVKFNGSSIANISGGSFNNEKKYGGVTFDYNVTGTITGGTFTFADFYTTKVKLSGGTFTMIKTNGDRKLADLLAEGAAYYGASDNQAVTNDRVNTLENVKVVSHTHNGGTDGKGICSVCKKQMAASLTIGDKTSWYTAFATAIEAANAADGAKTITLYQNVDDTVYGKRTTYELTRGPVTLATGGKRVDGVDLIAKGISLTVTGSNGSFYVTVDGKDAELTVNDKETKLAIVTAKNGGKLSLSNGTFSRVAVKDDGSSASLSGGSYGEITSDAGYVKPYALLAKGYAYKKTKDNQWLPNANSIPSEVTVEKAPFAVEKIYPNSDTNYTGNSAFATDGSITLTAVIAPETQGVTYYYWWERFDESSKDWTTKLNDVNTATHTGGQNKTLSISNLPENSSYQYHVYVSSDNGYNCYSEPFTVTRHQHSWTYTASGAAITATCSQCSANGGSVTIAAPDKSTLTYDGKGKQATLEGSFTTGVTPAISYTQTKPTQQTLENGTLPTNAGTYTASITMDSATASVTYTIGKATPKAEDFTFSAPDKLTYDGSDKVAKVTPKTGVTDMGDVTVKYYDKDGKEAKPKNAGEYTVKIDVAESTNYAAAQLTADAWKFTITKAAAPTNIPTGTLNVINGTYQTYTYDFSKLLPELSEGEYGTISYGNQADISLVSQSGYYYDETIVEFKNGVLILAQFYAKDGNMTGQIGTVKVKVTTTNYENFQLTLVLNAVNKITPVGTPTLSRTELTYGEPLSAITLSGKMEDPTTGAAVEGTFTWQNPDTVLDASDLGSDAEWKFTPTDKAAYTETTGTATVKVNKARQSGKVSMAGYTYGQTPSTPTLTDRTGDSNAPVTYEYSAANGFPVQMWDIQNPPALNAGTYRMSAKIGETSNYNECNAEYCEFVVAKATPTYTAPTGLTAKYGQTLEDVTLPDGWSWMDSKESVGDASAAAKPFKAKFTPMDTANYNTVENIELEVTVNQADGCSLGTVELTQKYMDASEHTYTPDWAGLPAGQDWTFSSTYSVSSGSAATLTRQDVAAADGNLLTYAISGGKAGDKITITLKASCNNYEDFTITLTITLTAKDDQAALTLTGGETVVYGQTLQLGTSGGNGNGAVTYAVTNGTGEATIDATGKLTPVKVGKVKVSATKAGDASYNSITSAEVEITITRATPTGAPKYTAITTSGKTLADAGLTTAGSTLNPNAGTLVWVDNAGNVLPATTTVEANTTYKWLFTPTDTNYTTLTGSIQLWHKSASSGGGSYYAPVVPDMPMLYRGCTGDAVKTLQEKLNAKGFDSGNVDGIFGAKTYAAVTAFQKTNSLGVDGIVGKLTWAKLYDATPVNVTPVTTQPMLRTGSRGDAVRKLQELLNAKGYTCGNVDGIFGSKTYAAVLAFQKANGLAADGIVGPLTWGKLV